MNAELLTIDKMFVATTGADRLSSYANNKVQKFTPTSDTNSSHVETLQTKTSDNIPAGARDEITHKPSENFSHTLRKTVDKKTQEAQGNTISEKQDPKTEASIKENTLQPTSTPESTISMSALVKEPATQSQTKTSLKPSKLIANLGADKSTPVTGHAAKSTEIKLLQTTGEKRQLGLKTVLPPKSNGQVGLKTILPNSSKSSDDRLVEGKNIDKKSISNKLSDSTKTPTNGKNVKKLTPDVIVGKNSKTTPAGEKTATKGASSVTSSQSTLSAKKLVSEATVDSPGKTLSIFEKTQQFNTNSPSVQNKSSASLSQSDGINPEKSALTDKKQSNNKTTAPQILSESSTDNTQDPKHSGKDFSGDSIAQKLNVTDVQISTNQTKNNNNSNSHFEQILSHNEPQTPITEQSPTSAQNAKTSNLPGQSSSNDVSADIGKQILESIHNSLSQQSGDRQITVRLNPPELGKVFIKFQEQDAQLTGLLEVSKTQTRTDIEQALPQIIRNLQDCGIQIKRLEVTLSNGEQSDQHSLRDQSLNNNADQQHDSANPGTWGGDPNTGEIYEWLTHNNGYLNFTELQEALITDGSINMLV